MPCLFMHSTLRWINSYLFVYKKSEIKTHKVMLYESNRYCSIFHNTSFIQVLGMNVKTHQCYELCHFVKIDWGIQKIWKHFLPLQAAEQSFVSLTLNHYEMREIIKKSFYTRCIENYACNKKWNVPNVSGSMLLINE